MISQLISFNVNLFSWQMDTHVSLTLVKTLLIFQEKNFNLTLQSNPESLAFQASVQTITLLSQVPEQLESSLLKCLTSQLQLLSSFTAICWLGKLFVINLYLGCFTYSNREILT